jgi:hypothetical protein
MGVLDYSGGYVIHLSSGTAGEQGILPRCRLIYTKFFLVRDRFYSCVLARSSPETRQGFLLSKQCPPHAGWRGYTLGVLEWVQRR